MNKNDNSALISIVIPVFNEEKNIQPMVEALQKILEGEFFEVLFIDDGSTDGTLATIKSLCTDVNCLRYVSFSRNFGHQNAIKAGFDHARGTCVITLDGDMQHPPALIPQMLRLWRSGAMVVNTQRMAVRSLPWVKKITTGIFYKLFDACSDVAIKPGTADFRLIDRKVVELCRQSREDVFFWRGLIPWMGFRQECISYTPNLRIHGTTKYSLKKMLHLAWAGISSFSLLPLRASFFLGGLVFVVAISHLLYSLYIYFTDAALPGWSSLMGGMLLLGSVQLVLLGIIGEYVGKTYMNSKHRPKYIVSEANTVIFDNRESI